MLRGIALKEKTSMERTKEFLLGMILSFSSWETWENVFISALVALLGGFLAAAGKALHNYIYSRFNKKKPTNEPSTIDSEPFS